MIIPESMILNLAAIMMGFIAEYTEDIKKDEYLYFGLDAVKSNLVRSSPHGDRIRFDSPHSAERTF